MANKLNELTGKQWLQYSFSIWRDIKKNSEEKKMNHPASFPEELASRIIEIFTKKGDNVLDPFLGSGTTIISAINTHRNCVGIDLSKDYCLLSKDRARKSIDNSNVNYSIICGDSMKEIDRLENSSFDLCVTSPPYWDILNMKRTVDANDLKKGYSKKEKDLGNITDYLEFINSMKKLFLKIKDKLKPDSYCVINVMDIRKKDRFYPLHMDLIVALKEIGYKLDDIIIWDRQNEYNNMKPLGYPYKFRINKVHEYLLIFYKEK